MNAWRKAAVALEGGVVLLVASLGLAACGGPSRHTTTAAADTAHPAIVWAENVCEVLVAYSSVSRDHAITYTRELQNNPSMSPAQSAGVLDSYLGEVVSDTQTLVQATRDSGYPTVPGGQKIASSLVGSFDSLLGVYKQAQQSASTLPTSSAADLNEATKPLTVMLAAQNGVPAADVDKAAAADPTGTLDQAFSKAPSCAGLGLSPGGSTTTTSTTAPSAAST